MDYEIRNKRLRLLIARLNRARKKQGQQIDILCNDFITAQKDFVKTLKAIGFAADFYESIAGLTDLNELLCTAGNLIQKQIPDANIAFFLLQPRNFELHIFESEIPIEPEGGRIENLFTAEIVDNLAKSNRICTLDDMLAMGLLGSPVRLEKISAAAVPLSTSSGSSGFILVYRSSQKRLTADELKCVAQVTSGLARSINACKLLVPVTCE